MLKCLHILNFSYNFFHIAYLIPAEIVLKKFFNFMNIKVISFDKEE